VRALPNAYLVHIVDETHKEKALTCVHKGDEAATVPCGGRAREDEINKSQMHAQVGLVDAAEALAIAKISK